MNLGASGTRAVSLRRILWEEIMFEHSCEGHVARAGESIPEGCRWEPWEQFQVSMWAHVDSALTGWADED